MQTFARRDGERWIINGHKTWTSLAHFATWMILLCRTDRADKYRGLSYFVVPIKAALGRGVTVRPLVKMTGEGGFNEVLLEDLVVDDGLRIAAIGDGWNVAMTTLLHERGAGPLVTPASGNKISEEPSLASDSPAGSDASSATGLVELAKRCYRAGKPVADDPVFRDQIVKILIRQRALVETSRRAQVPSLNEHPMRLPLQRKLTISELLQDTARLACAIEGIASSLRSRRRARPGGRPVAARAHELVWVHHRRWIERGAAQHPGRACARPGQVEVNERTRMVQPRSFGFGEEAQALKLIARRFFQEHCPAEALHRFVARDPTPAPRPQCIWDEAPGSRSSIWAGPLSRSPSAPLASG